MSTAPAGDGALVAHPPVAAPKCCTGAWFAAAALVVFFYALDQATKLWTAGLDLGRPGWPVL